MDIFNSGIVGVCILIDVFFAVPGNIIENRKPCGGFPVGFTVEDRIFIPPDVRIKIVEGNLHTLCGVKLDNRGRKFKTLLEHLDGFYGRIITGIFIGKFGGENGRTNENHKESTGKTVEKLVSRIHLGVFLSEK